MARSLIASLVPLLVLGSKLLIPMDGEQTDHLKAYGIAYSVLGAGLKVEWLLNYRGGSFLIDDNPPVAKDCRIKGVTCTSMGQDEVLAVYSTVQASNMEAVLLEKAPRVAVYIPPHLEPWDDAVTLALEYAAIPYDRLWDEEVVKGKLAKYDWLHLHHEDFTGQHGKFWAQYQSADWYKDEVRINEAMARRLGFKKVSQLKKAVALEIKRYVEQGGFLFSMCSACDTYEIALAADAVDICAEPFDRDPVSPSYASRLDFSNCLAFEDFTVIPDPYVYEHSDIDVYSEAILRGPETYFSLFEFSAKFDPVPTMLVQDHTALVKEFMGQCVGFHRDRLKKAVVVLGEVSGTDEVKYLHGNFGKGTFTYLGGHDPEDFQHFVYDPPTKLEYHKNSPGYRLILNNVLFPAAEKKPLKT
jgi:hypothetical protein